MVAIRSRPSCVSLSKVSSSKAINLRTTACLLRRHRLVINGSRSKWFQPGTTRGGKPRAMAARRSAEHPVLPEPGLHPAPRVLGGFLAIACAIIGMEAMRRAWIDLEFSGLPGRCQRRLQRLDRRNGNAGIRLAIQAQHRRLHIRCELGRALRPERVRWIDRRAVKRAARLEASAVRGIFPDRPSAAAESDNAEPVGIAALRLGPGDRAVE